MKQNVADILKDETETPPCQSCGACCAYYKTVGVDSDDDNFQFLFENGFIEDDAPNESYKMKADQNSRCVALRGVIGEKVECSIYENRPLGCREYVAGAGSCQIARVFTFAKFSK